MSRRQRPVMDESDQQADLDRFQQESPYHHYSGMVVDYGDTDQHNPLDILIPTADGGWRRQPSFRSYRAMLDYLRQEELEQQQQQAQLAADEIELEDLHRLEVLQQELAQLRLLELSIQQEKEREHEREQELEERFVDDRYDRLYDYDDDEVVD